MSRLSRDFTGYSFYALRKLRLFINPTLRTLMMKISLKLRGIRFQKGLKFHGRAVLIRMPESSIEIGKNCRFRSDYTSNLVGINRKCLVSTMRKKALIKIGNNCGISGAVIGAVDKIEIGDKVLLGANCFVTDFDWHNTDPSIRHQKCENSKPVKINNNVWIGMNTIVLKGVEIGENSVIGANSVVTKSIPANVIAGGNPCKVIKELNK